MMNRLWSYGRWAALIAWTLAVCALIVSRYPGFFTPELKPDTGASQSPEDTFGAQLILLEPEPKTTPGHTFLYRESMARDGVHRHSRVPLPVREHWRTSRLNVGIHSASKSSPAVDESGVYVGADSAWIYAFTHEGTPKWRFFAAGSGQGVHGGPVLDADRLYALDKRDGRPHWVRRFGDAIGSTPLIEGDHLYVSAETFTRFDGYMGKLKKDGTPVWIGPAWANRCMRPRLWMPATGESF